MIYSRYIIEKKWGWCCNTNFHFFFSSFPEEILDIGNLLCHGYQIYFSLDSTSFQGTWLLTALYFFLLLSQCQTKVFGGLENSSVIVSDNIFIEIKVKQWRICQKIEKEDRLWTLQFELATKSTVLVARMLEECLTVFITSVKFVMWSCFWPDGFNSSSEPLWSITSMSIKGLLNPWIDNLVPYLDSKSTSLKPSLNLHSPFLKCN